MMASCSVFKKFNNLGTMPYVQKVKVGPLKSSNKNKIVTTWAHCHMCTGGFISAKQTGHSSSFLDGDMTLMMILMMKMTLGKVLSENDIGDSDVDASKDLRSAGQSLASSFPLVGDFTLSMNSSACLKRSAASLYQIHVKRFCVGHRLFSNPIIVVCFLEEKKTNRSARVLSLV